MQLLGLFEGIYYLHTRSPPIIHGDLHDVGIDLLIVYSILIFLKRNVVVSRTGDCMLCDFGLSRIRHEISRTHTTIHQGGRERFIAPEIASGIEWRINEKSDIYSLAMTIYALGTKSFPFEHIDRGAVACKLAREGERPQKPSSLGGLTAEETEHLWTLMERMWNHNPQHRPTVSRARDEISRSGLMCLELSAPIVASSMRVRPPTPPTSVRSTNKTIQHVSAPSDVDPLIGDAALELPYSAPGTPFLVESDTEVSSNSSGVNPLGSDAYVIGFRRWSQHLWLGESE